MSEQPAAAPATPTRSSTERAIVWGVIGIGLVVIAIEGWAHTTHGAAYSHLSGLVNQNKDVDKSVTKADVDKVMGSRTPETQKLGPMQTGIGASRVDIYSFPGLIRERKVYVYYGIQGRQGQEADVLEVSDAPTESAEAATQRALKEHPPEASPKATGGMAPPMGGGPAGGGPRGKNARPKAEEDQSADEKKPDADDKPAESKPEAKKTAAEKPADEKPAESKTEKSE